MLLRWTCSGRLRISIILADICDTSIELTFIGLRSVRCDTAIHHVFVLHVIINLCLNLLWGQGLVDGRVAWRHWHVVGLLALQIRASVRLILALHCTNWHSINKVGTELFNKNPRVAGCGLRSCRRYRMVILLILAAVSDHIFFRHYLTLGFCGYLFHELDDSAEHTLVQIEIVLLFLSADKDEFWILLSRPTLHLDKCAHCLDLIQADYLVAGGDVKALLDHIRSD